MSAHPPPVPPDQQPKHGSHPAEAPDKDTTKVSPQHDNFAEQGATANVRQNTTARGRSQNGT